MEIELRKRGDNNQKKKLSVKKIILSLVGVIIVLFVIALASAIWKNFVINDSIDNKSVLADFKKKRLEAEIHSIVNKMTLEEKIAQLFIITPEALNSGKEITTANKFTKEAISKYPVGGLIFFSKNINSPEQIKIMISNTQDYSRERIQIPMFMSVDEEGGQVARIANNSAFNVETFGNLSGTKSSQEAYMLGDTIGKYLNDYGFNLNYAPVADIYTNPKNIVIKYRAFSSEPLIVADYVVEEIKGLNNNKIIASLKHFPGHGNTTKDSHNGYAVTYKTLEQLKAVEFIPFEKGISAGAQIVMLAHISVPNIIKGDIPSSLSEIMVKDILRNELDFEGVIITDALNMGAITNKYNSEQASITAIKAGVDLLLMPENFIEAYNGLLNAVIKGEISQERIDESLYRILLLKKDKLNW